MTYIVRPGNSAIFLVSEVPQLTDCKSIAVKDRVAPLRASGWIIAGHGHEALIARRLRRGRKILGNLVETIDIGGIYGDLMELLVVSERQGGIRIAGITVNSLTVVTLGGRLPYFTGGPDPAGSLPQGSVIEILQGLNAEPTLKSALHATTTLIKEDILSVYKLMTVAGVYNGRTGSR